MSDNVTDYIRRLREYVELAAADGDTPRTFAMRASLDADWRRLPLWVRVWLRYRFVRWHVMYLWAKVRA